MDNSASIQRPRPSGAPSNERLSNGRPGLLGAVTARAEAQVLRLSCLFAVADGAVVIGPRHLHAALEVWRYCFDSARYVFGAAIGDPTADAIDQALRRTADGLTRRDLLHNVFGRNRSAAEIGRALTLLEHAGLAYHQVDHDTGGRAADRWFAGQPDDLNDLDDLRSADDAQGLVRQVVKVAGEKAREGTDADLF